MSDWRQSGMRSMMDRKKECRYCPTSGIVKKMKDAASRVKKHFQDLWTDRKKNKK